MPPERVTLATVLLALGCAAPVGSMAPRAPTEAAGGARKQAGLDHPVRDAVSAYLQILDERNLLLAGDEGAARAHAESFASSVPCNSGSLRLGDRAVRNAGRSAELGTWSQETIVLRSNDDETLLLDRGVVIFFGQFRPRSYDRAVTLQRRQDRWVVAASARPNDPRCLSPADRALVARARRTNTLDVCLASHRQCEARCERARERDWARLGLASCQRCFFDECACGLARCIGAQGAVETICEGIP